MHRNITQISINSTGTKKNKINKINKDISSFETTWFTQTIGDIADRLRKRWLYLTNFKHRKETFVFRSKSIAREYS